MVSKYFPLLFFTEIFQTDVQMAGCAATCVHVKNKNDVTTYQL